MRRHRAMAAALLLVSAPILGACDEKVSAEEAGREIGRAVDDAGEQFGWIATELTAVIGRALKSVGIALENDAESRRLPPGPGNGQSGNGAGNGGG